MATPASGRGEGGGRKNARTGKARSSPTAGPSGSSRRPTGWQKPPKTADSRSRILVGNNP
ncbi:hypothetical protein ADK56_05835 [Streptomyces sp. MMG1522]|nr:hypothetical protein ADK56_05835 [Streptomyces sp. MMG1522]